MKIMLVIRWPVGGIRTYLDYVFQHAVLHKNTYIIVAPDLEMNDYVKKVFSAVPYQFIVSENNATDLYKKARKAISTEKPDIVHSHGTTAGVVVALALMMKRTHHIVTMHDVFFEAQYQGLFGFFKRKSIGLFLAHASIVNPCGLDAAENIKEFFPSIDVNNLSPIRNGIEVKRFAVSSARDLKTEAGISNDALLLGFFGRFMKQKGFDLLVSAVDELVNGDVPHNVHVACFGWGGYIREEQQVIREMRLEHVFTFFEQTNDMPEALRGVDVAVMPSRWEACPLLPMEALVSGVPIVASDCVGMKEVCEGSPVVTFDSGSSTSLFEAIRYAISDLPLIKSQSAEYSHVALEKFDSKYTAASLNKLYLSLCND